MRLGKDVEGEDCGQQLLVGKKLGSRHVQGFKEDGESLQQATEAFLGLAQDLPHLINWAASEVILL